MVKGVLGDDETPAGSARYLNGSINARSDEEAVRLATHVRGRQAVWRK